MNKMEEPQYEEKFTIEEIYKQLEILYRERATVEIEQFLVACLKKAGDLKEYGIYLSVGNEMIGFYRFEKKYDQAYGIAEDILLLMEELSLDNTEHFANSLLNIGTTYQTQGNYKEALVHYKRALQIYEAKWLDTDLRFANIYNNMSVILGQLGEIEQAAFYLEKAILLIQQDTSNEFQLEEGTTRTNLALLYLQMNRVEEAKQQLERAVTIFETTETDIHYSAALAGIGEAYFYMNETQKALEAYEKSLVEIKKQVGENSSYALICDNCAALCEILKDTKKQQYYIQLSEKIKETIK